MILAYRKYLEQDQYRNVLIDYYIRNFGQGDEQMTLNRLSLGSAVLHNIYYRNPPRFLGIAG